jgi:hypothetical protein
MDFDEVYIAGEHQWERMRQRTNEENIYNMVRNSQLVMLKGKEKYFKHDNAIIPALKSDKVNIIKTVLSKDMEVKEMDVV